MGNTALSEVGFGIGMVVVELVLTVAVVALAGSPSLVCKCQRYGGCDG